MRRYIEDIPDGEYLKALVRIATDPNTDEKTTIGHDEEGDFLYGYDYCEHDEMPDDNVLEEDEPRWIDDDNETEEELDDGEDFD